MCTNTPFYMRQGKPVQSLEAVPNAIVKPNSSSLRGKRSRMVQTPSGLGKEIRKIPSLIFFHLTLGDSLETILFFFKA